MENRLHKKMDKPREVFLRAVKTFLNTETLEYDKTRLSTISTNLLKSVHILERYGDGYVGTVTNQSLRCPAS